MRRVLLWLLLLHAGEPQLFLLQRMMAGAVGDGLLP